MNPLLALGGQEAKLHYYFGISHSCQPAHLCYDLCLLSSGISLLGHCWFLIFFLMGINRRRRKAQDRLAGCGFAMVFVAVTAAAVWVSLVKQSRLYTQVHHACCWSTASFLGLDCSRGGSVKQNCCPSFPFLN